MCPCVVGVPLSLEGAVSDRRELSSMALTSLCHRSVVSVSQNPTEDIGRGFSKPSHSVP